MNSRRSLWALALAAIALQSIAPRASAGPTPTPEEQARVRADMRVATQKLRDRDWAGAEALLLPAFALSPTFDIASNLGTAECALNKFVKCEEHLAYSIRTWPIMDSTAARHAAVEKLLNDTRARLGTLIITTTPAGAEIMVDDRALGRSPLKDKIYVEPGKHTVTATLSQYKVATQGADVAKGATANVGLVLLPDEAPFPTSSAAPTLSASTPPPATSARVTPLPTSRSVAPIVAGSIFAGVFVGVGVGLLVAANSSATNAREIAATVQGSCAPATAADADACGRVNDARSSEGLKKTMGLVSFLAAGAAGLTGMLIYATSSPKPSSSAARVYVSPNGVLVQGNF
jgi:hypothetical protein